MKSIRWVMATAIVIAMTSGCGDDNGSGPPSSSLQMSDLVGTWEATSIVASDQADPSRSIDLIALGAVANAKFESNRRVAFVSTFQGDTDASTGSVTIGDGILSVAGDGDQPSRTIGCGIADGCLEIDYGLEPYDFDGDGADETARISMKLERCPDDFPVSDMAGSWEATSWLLASDEDPLVEEVDVIAEGGAATVTIGTDGRYTLELTPPGELMETEVGSMRVVGAHLVALPDDDPGSPEAFRCEMTLMTMTLLQTNAGWDFDDDGEEEDATAVITWVRL